MSSKGDLRLLFVRHGETQDNIERKLQGHRDTSLTQKGLGEAQLLASNLENRQIDTVYHSPLLRISQTIDPILNSHSIEEVHADGNLKGQGLGQLEGRSYDEVDFGNPRDADVHPGVEKFDDFIGRLRDTVGRIVATEAPKVGDKDRIVLVASHGVCITSIFKVLENTPPCDGFAPPVALRGPGAYEVRWPDSDDVASLVISEPSKLPVDNGMLQWNRIEDQPFLIETWGKKEKAL